MSNDKTAHDLIIEIDKRGKKSRTFALAAQVVMLFGILFLSGLGLRSYERQQEIQRQQTQYIKCVLVFFSLPDRATSRLNLDKVDECSIFRNGTPQDFFTTNKDGDVETTTDQQDAPAPTTQDKPSDTPTTSQEVPQAPVAQNPTLTPSQPQNEQPGLVGGIIKNTDDLINQLREGVLQNDITRL